VIPAGELVILDTGVLVQLVRYNAAGKRIDEQLRLTGRQERPLISVVAVGELHALALKLGWGREKVRQLSEVVRQLVVVDISRTDVIHRYAQIDEFSERQVKPARPLGQNDMWIAATAAAYDAHLVTTDTDFDHLTPRFIRRTRIDPRTGEVQT
jgi:tRNA(fMet)-specific endonuclease VapC